ncbi:A24 family peptidase [Burkholderia cenocepacia]
MSSLISIGIFLAWAMLVAANDIHFRRIPNSLVGIGFCGGLGCAFFGAGPFGVFPMQALIGTLIGLLAFFPFFLLRVMGAADVKVFAVLGAWCGPHALLWFWIVASLAAGVHGLVLMALSNTSLGASWRRGTPAMTLGGRRAAPYAAFLVLPATVWLLHIMFVRGV